MPLLDDPTLPLPTWKNVKGAVRGLMGMVTPPDPYVEAGRMVQQARGGDYIGALETGVAAMPTTGSMRVKVDPPNSIPQGSVVRSIPLDAIEHGESAMPGGKLTWPGAKDIIRDYASRQTPIPPIELIKRNEDEIVEYLNETGIRLPDYFISDGSHRYEAAKLRGMNEIPAVVFEE